MVQFMSVTRSIDGGAFDACLIEHIVRLTGEERSSVARPGWWRSMQIAFYKK